MQLFIYFTLSLSLLCRQQLSANVTDMLTLEEVGCGTLNTLRHKRKPFDHEHQTYVNQVFHSRYIL